MLPVQGAVSADVNIHSSSGPTLTSPTSCHTTLQSCAVLKQCCVWCSCLTGVATPMPGAPRGTYTLVVDESGKKASWILELCDVPEYVASHLHIVSPGPHIC
jgi:hypothetical protein